MSLNVRRNSGDIIFGEYGYKRDNKTIDNKLKTENDNKLKYQFKHIIF